jgi:hypothetical protein
LVLRCGAVETRVLGRKSVHLPVNDRQAHRVHSPTRCRRSTDQARMRRVGQGICVNPSVLPEISASFATQDQQLAILADLDIADGSGTRDTHRVGQRRGTSGIEGPDVENVALGLPEVPGSCVGVIAGDPEIGAKAVGHVVPAASYTQSHRSMAVGGHRSKSYGSDGESASTLGGGDVRSVALRTRLARPGIVAAGNNPDSNQRCCTNPNDHGASWC